MEITVENDVEILRQAIQLAADLNHHLFDTLYHATAIATQGIFITADQRYYRKAEPLGDILQLQDWEITTDSK